jgi:hypothetical protein
MKIQRLSQSGHNEDDPIQTLGGKPKAESTKIVKSTPDASGEMKILDRSSPVDEIPVDVRMHGASIIERDKQIRERKKQQGKPEVPEVQLRPTEPKSWRDVKDGKDDLG